MQEIAEIAEIAKEIHVLRSVLYVTIAGEKAVIDALHKKYKQVMQDEIISRTYTYTAKHLREDLANMMNMSTYDFNVQYFWTVEKELKKLLEDA